MLCSTYRKRFSNCTCGADYNYQTASTKKVDGKYVSTIVCEKCGREVKGEGETITKSVTRLVNNWNNGYLGKDCVEDITHNNDVDISTVKTSPGIFVTTAKCKKSGIQVTGRGNTVNSSIKDASLKLWEEINKHSITKYNSNTDSSSNNRDSNSIKSNNVNIDDLYKSIDTLNKQVSALVSTLEKVCMLQSNTLEIQKQLLDLKKWELQGVEISPTCHSESPIV